MPLSRELVQAVRQKIAECPDMPEAQIAAELNAREVDVITALPVSMRRRARFSDALTIWKQARRWKNATILRSSPDPAELDGLPVLLQEGPASPPPGRQRTVAREAECNDGQRTRPGRGSLWFVSKPLQGAHSRALHLFDADGRRVVSLFLGREGNGQGKEASDFDRLRDRYGVIHQPKMRCRGCASCTCASK